jgi:hypothetical protein
LVAEGIVPVAAVDKDADGRVQARWYDAEVLCGVAARMRRMKKRAERQRRAKKAAVARRAANALAARETATPARPDDYRPEREEYRPELRLRAAKTPPSPVTPPVPLGSPMAPAKPTGTLDEALRQHLDGMTRPRPLTQVPAHWLTDPIPGEPSESSPGGPPAPTPSGALPVSRSDRLGDDDAPPSSKTGS